MVTRPMIITPEAQIRSTIRHVKHEISKSRKNQRPEAIRKLAHELKWMLDQYSLGELEPYDDGLPF